MRRKENTEIETEAISAYAEDGSLRRTAERFNISHVTLWRFVKRYNNLKYSYHKPWNRFGVDIEERVMFLKENRPWLTLRQTKEILKKQNIKISLKGIHSIWKRYGLINHPLENIFSPMANSTPESKEIIEKVKFILLKNSDHKTLKNAAEILNKLPAFPIEYSDILKKIPERYLSLRRRLDKLDAEFMETFKVVVYQKARRLRKMFEKSGFLYSSVWAGIIELLALHWLRMPKKELQLNRLLRKRVKNIREPALNMALTFLSGAASAELLDVENAIVCARKCRRLLTSLRHPNTYIMVGDLMTFITDYGEALKYYNKALELEKEDYDIDLCLRIALVLVLGGEYKKAQNFLKNRSNIASDSEDYTLYLLIKALLNLGLGSLEKAVFYLKECLEKSKKIQFRNYIYMANFCLAVIEQALGNEKRAQVLLQESLVFLKKYHMMKHRATIESLLGKTDVGSIRLPVLYLISLLRSAQTSLKIKDFNKALNYAKKKGLMGFFERVIVFFPELITGILTKKQNPGVSKRLLRLPIFMREIPVYQIKFLGKMIIYRNHKYFRVLLTPKEKAFLIHLALRVGEPGKSIFVDQLYKNFWPKSKNPSSQLSHLLVRLKKRMHLPSHLFVVSHNQVNKLLINKGVYFTTDYKDFELNLVQAKALMNSGEWCYVCKKYMSAFKLFRARPFEHMYDPWSEQMRQAVINRLENGLQEFLEQCLIHKNRADVKRILNRKALRDFIPAEIKAQGLR